MKKRIFLMLPCIAAVAIAAFVGTTTLESNASKNCLLMENVEAFSQNDFPDGWRQGYAMSTIWYKESVSAGIEISLTEPGFWASIGVEWKSLRCCMKSVDGNACNFNVEESKCKNTAVR